MLDEAADDGRWFSVSVGEVTGSDDITGGVDGSGLVGS